ncbi:MAG: potassium channel family protein, partial [Cyclobacteriaceae bacterium]
ISITFSLVEGMDNRTSDFVRMGVGNLIYTIVSQVIFRLVWGAVSVKENIILGLISGYLSLGLIGFFICSSVEVAEPGAFNGLSADPDLRGIELNYYSYVTLLTIGYGDIVPLTNLARTTSVLIGLMGQMYIVIITAVVVGKYINQSATEVRE